MKFSKDCEGLQIIEVDLDDVFIHFVDSPTPVIVNYTYDGKVYPINMAATRYGVFYRQRSCQCCGIIGNRMFLEPYTEESTGREFHRFMLYAETKYKPDGETHLNLLTVDHIVPKRIGGSDDPSNLQTLCRLCNYAKDLLGLRTHQICDCLGLMDGINRASYTVRKSRKAMEKDLADEAAMEKAIAAMTAGLEKIRPEKRDELLEKLKAKKTALMILREENAKRLLQAQTSG